MEMVETSGSSTAQRWTFGANAIVLAVVCAGLLAAVFHDGGRELLHLWEAKEEYSHAYLLPFIALFLIWQRKNELAAQPWSGDWRGTALTLFGLLVFFVGTLGTIYAIVQYALFVTLAGLLLSYAGFRNLRYLWAALVLLLFTVPFPQFIYQALSTRLQLLSSELGVAVIRAAGVGVFLEGNVIDLGTFKLQVIEACNGLRYLFPLTSFGFLCAYLYRGPLWQKLVVVLSTIPITVLMNSFRIGVIGLTVDRWGQSMAEGFLHDFEGWAIFMACLAVLFVEMALLARLQRPRRTFADTFYVEIPGPSSGRPVQHPVPRQFLVSIALLVIAGVITLSLAKRDEIIPERSSFASFPLEVGEWRGSPQALEQMYIDVLKFTDYVMVNFRHEQSHEAVNFYVAYYASQRAGESAHSPRSCIPGGGWKIEGFSQIPIPGQGPATDPRPVNRVEIAMGDNRQLVYYWFQQRGRRITNEYLVKWYLLWDAITRNRSDGALVRLTTIIPVGGSWEDGDRVLQRFIGDLGNRLTAYVPD